ncbi:phosphoribosyl-AMP cyclohydrolase [Parazoarcus communis]|uniref:phosphoribosyl-AMP cyclohydrolase n=1 Tax=Parazoarcus communis TaxID=41977 RepID=UPI001FB45BCF|nr:phosphoribosyl-AMP cyclohydrolase [Parazoarcus communis]
MSPHSETPLSTSARVQITLHPRTSIEQVEEGTELAPKFDQDGLIACVTTAADSGDVLMLGYMNREALEKTIQTGEAHYWSRSRQKLWHKGASSGLVQKVEEMRIDDDQDAVWLRVRVSGSRQRRQQSAMGSDSIGSRITPERSVRTSATTLAALKRGSPACPTGHSLNPSHSTQLITHESHAFFRRP